jgi:hypothetical protein
MLRLQCVRTTLSRAVPDSRRVILRNLIELNASFAIRTIARLAGAVLLLNRLGLAGYGKLSWALTLVYVGVGDDLGLGFWATRAAASDPQFYKTHASGFIALSLVTRFSRWLLLAIALPFVCPDPDVARLAFGHAIAPIPGAFAMGWILFAHNRTSALRTATVIREGLWLLGLALLVHQVSDLPRTIPLAIAVEIVEVIALGIPTLRAEGLFDLRPRIPPIRELFAAVLPLWAGGRLFHLRAHLGTLVIGWSFGSVGVAIFDLAWRIAFNLWAFGGTSLSSITPTLFRLAAVPGEMFALLRRSLVLAWVVSLLAVVAVPAAGPLLVTLFRRDGAAVTVPLAWLLCMLVPAILRGPMRVALFALGRVSVLAVLAAIDVALFAVVLLFARRAGAVGLASAMCGVEVLLGAISFLVLGPELRTGVGNALWRSIVAALVAIPAAFAVRSLLPLAAVVVGPLVYIGVLWLLRDPTIDEIAALAARRLAREPSP